MARLRVLYGKVPLHMVELDMTSVVVGRGPDATINIEDPVVSRVHCRIEDDGNGGHVVTDLDSGSGTFVGGLKVKRHPLADGDRIELGRHTLVYHCAGVDPAWGRERMRAPIREAGVDAASDFAHLQKVADQMNAFNATKAASTHEVLNMRDALASQQSHRIVWQSGGERHAFPFRAPGVVFRAGRQKDADARIPGFRFGPKEVLTVTRRGGKFEIEVLNAKEEVEVDGARVTGKRMLRFGEEIRVGKMRFRLIKGRSEGPST